MKTKKADQIQLIELNTGELKQIDGGGLLSAIKTAAAAGSIWALAAIFIFEETVTSPMASYDAFMRGWDACK